MTNELAKVSADAIGPVGFGLVALAILIAGYAFVLLFLSRLEQARGRPITVLEVVVLAVAFPYSLLIIFFVEPRK